MTYHDNWSAKVVDYVKYAIDNSKYYHNKINLSCLNDLKSIPILKKNDVKNNYSNILINDKNQQEKHILKKHTSGTSGEPLNVYWNNKDYVISNLFVWKLRRIWYNIYPIDRLVTFHSATNNFSYSSQKYIKNNTVLSLERCVFTDAILNEYCDEIRKFDPSWILGPPSTIFLILNYMKEHKIILKNLKYVEFNGEYVEKHFINTLKMDFGIMVSNLYGSEEFNGIAMTCPNGNMHIITDNVYVETDKFQENKLLITSLVNKLMPFIRYDIGDYGYVYKGGVCACGYNDIYLDLIRGRSNDMVTIGNSIISMSLFNQIIDEMNYSKNKVKQFFVRFKNNKFTLFILTDFSYIIELQIQKEYFINKLCVKSGLTTQFFELEIFDDPQLFFNSKSKFSYFIIEE